MGPGNPSPCHLFLLLPLEVEDPPPGNQSSESQNMGWGCGLGHYVQEGEGAPEEVRTAEVSTSEGQGCTGERGWSQEESSMGRAGHGDTCLCLERVLWR